ncbi:DUF2380 domain-containing protein [Methylotenera sp.]|uniref:DUF2380 domain-containing protein n=1 Tax=Methylotenera sp. TaxID=2051956 RepID=UPI0027321261|nr:DUF2380 domain-containing protein [Methylotenera sp.]MDP2230875.1 DUF2380 domain-containing protein [Methylotenera sp.]MDP3140291.1 DUF2380 domain-containing protein [Methylotenera sp.]
MKNLILKVIFLLSLAGLVSLTACAGPTTTKPIVAQTTTESANALPVTTEPTIAEPAVAPTATTSIGKVMVLDFPLNDLTDLPNPPEELARIAHFNVSFKQRLVNDGVEIVPVNEQIKAISSAQSATYLFDHTDIAASLAEGSGADYIIIGVAMKPTYLFVYPRLLLVDIKTKRKAFTSYVQMEGSWLENHTTASSANRLADKVSAELKKLAGQAN